MTPEDSLGRIKAAKIMHFRNSGMPWESNYAVGENDVLQIMCIYQSDGFVIEIYYHDRKEMIPSQMLERVILRFNV